MEAFLATNESQWEVIKKVIDECDYYILIIGGRYGTTTKEGISYTEKEFNYAKSISVPALCFVHGEPDNIAASKSEGDQAGRDRLTAFRNRVMEDHPVRKWTNAYELGGAGISQPIKGYKSEPTPGMDEEYRHIQPRVARENQLSYNRERTVKICARYHSTQQRNG